MHEGQAYYRLKENHQYYDQVQGQLHVLNAAACDFVVWTKKDISIVRVMKDCTWTPNMSKLINFYFDKVIPQIGQADMANI
jgi:hypothetical protein